MKTLDELAQALKARKFADAVALPAAQRTRIEKAIAEHAEEGLHAYVVEAEKGRPLEPLRALWSKLGLDAQRDLLLLHNGERWEAKGWGLKGHQVGLALDGAEGALDESVAAGVALALERLAAAATGNQAPAREHEGLPWGWLSLAGVTLGGVGWVIARRRKLAKERQQRISAALSLAEATQAEVVLSADELSTEHATDVQLRAARLGEELRRVASDESADEQLVVGRVRQLESELNALHSEVLARRQRS